MPHILVAAQQRHLFPDMENKALLSISKCCDNGYSTIFDKSTLTLQHNTDPNKLFEGAHDKKKGMLHIDLVLHKRMTTKRVETTHWLDTPTTKSKAANNVYDFTMKRDIVKYLHQAAGSPTPTATMWIISINNYNYTI